MGQPHTSFREAISRARLETVEVDLPSEISVPRLTVEPPVEAAPPRFEYRVVAAGGSSRKRARRFCRLGRKGWELVSVSRGQAYFKRPVG
jgi:hypothetical protein